MYNSYTSKRYAPFGALQVSVEVRSYRPLVVVHQVADTVYQRADACRHRLFLFSVIKNTMENRKCQLQTWKVEKYSGNLCAARTGRGVLGKKPPSGGGDAVPTAGGELAAFGGTEMPFPRQGGIGRLLAAGDAGVHRREVPCPRRGKNAVARRRGQKGARAPYGSLAPS